MTRPWYQTDSKGYEALCSEIEGKYPELECIAEDGIAAVRGYYPVCDGNQVLDRYLIDLSCLRLGFGDFPAYMRWKAGSNAALTIT